MGRLSNNSLSNAPCFVIRGEEGVRGGGGVFDCTFTTGRSFTYSDLYVALRGNWCRHDVWNGFLNKWCINGLVISCIMDFSVVRCVIARTRFFSTRLRTASAKAS